MGIACWSWVLYDEVCRTSPTWYIALRATTWADLWRLTRVMAQAAYWSLIWLRYSRPDSTVGYKGA